MHVHSCMIERADTSAHYKRMCVHSRWRAAHVTWAAAWLVARGVLLRAAYDMGSDMDARRWPAALATAWSAGIVALWIGTVALWAQLAHASASPDWLLTAPEPHVRAVLLYAQLVGAIGFMDTLMSVAAMLVAAFAWHALDVVNAAHMATWVVGAILGFSAGVHLWATAFHVVELHVDASGGDGDGVGDGEAVVRQL